MVLQIEYRFEDLDIHKQPNLFYCFTSHSRIIHLYGEVTIAGKGLQNLGVNSGSEPLSRDGPLSCYTCCDTGPRFFRSHP
jgi:hypothetical protein